MRTANLLGRRHPAQSDVQLRLKAQASGARGHEVAPMTGSREAMQELTSYPAKRCIRYAEAFQFITAASGTLDHPHSRMMTRIRRTASSRCSLAQTAFVGRDDSGSAPYAVTATLRRAPICTWRRALRPGFRSSR